MACKRSSVQVRYPPLVINLAESTTYDTYRRSVVRRLTWSQKGTYLFGVSIRSRYRASFNAEGTVVP